MRGNKSYNNWVEVYLHFLEDLIEDSNGRWDINSFVLSLGSRLGCCWGWWKFCSSLAFRDTLLGTVGLADLGMDLMVLFFFCDFFWGLGMLKRPETIVCGDIGLVLLSGLGSRRTHPVGAEGATMARRAPFPISSIPAYIDQSMKLFVCNISTRQPISGSAFRKFRFGAIQFIIFRQSFDWGFQWAMRYQFICSVIRGFTVGFTVEAVVEVGESSARVWPFGTRCWGLSAWLI